MLILGGAKNYIGQYEDAVVWLHRSIETGRANPFAHFHLAAALALSGRLEEARAAASAGLALNPQFTLGRYLGSLWGYHPRHIASRKLIAEGLRRAGVPE